MVVSVIGIIILHLLRHDKELQRKKIKPLYREFVIQNIGNSLSAESLLATNSEIITLLPMTVENS